MPLLLPNIIVIRLSTQTAMFAIARRAGPGLAGG